MTPSEESSRPFWSAARTCEWCGAESYYLYGSGRRGVPDGWVHLWQNVSPSAKPLAASRDYRPLICGECADDAQAVAE